MNIVVCLDTSQTLTLPTTTISHLPDELLTQIFSYLLPPPLRPSEYDIPSGATSDLVAVCSVSHRFRDIAEPLCWHTLVLEQHIPRDCTACTASVERTCQHHTENGAIMNLYPMARQPGFAARHVRELRFGAFGYGWVPPLVLRAYREPAAQRFLEKTYSAELVEFTRRFFEEAAVEIGADGTQRGSIQLGQILALCLTPNLRAVHFDIEEPTQGPLTKFLAFLEAMPLSRPRENVVQAEDEEEEPSHLGYADDEVGRAAQLLRRPLGKVESLRIWSCWENRDVQSPVIARLLRLPRLSEVCTMSVDLDSHAGDSSSTFSLTKDLRRLDLHNTNLCLGSLSSLLQQSPDLERLAISFDSSLEDALGMADLGEVLSRCKNLRQLDLDFWYTCWVDDTRGDIIGGFRDKLPTIEKLRMPLVQLIGDEEAVGDIAGALPSSLRWLWTVVMEESSGKPEDGGLMHVNALQRFFGDVSERMPHLEGVVAEVPEKWMDLLVSSSGFKAEKDGGSRMIFRRVEVPDQSGFLQRAEVPTDWRDAWLDREALQRSRR